jgi:hypothetical protein
MLRETATATMLFMLAEAVLTVAMGWSAAESPAYRASIDHRAAHSGRASLLLKSESGDVQGFAAVQRIRAGAWRGKRIRLSGWLKSSGTDRGGALWLRIDMANGDYILDGMLESSPAGWTRKEIVASVPVDAVGISFGVRMAGRGEVWADDFVLEPAPGTVPVTTIERRKNPKAGDIVGEFGKAPARAVNLGFEN